MILRVDKATKLKIELRNDPDDADSMFLIKKFVYFTKNNLCRNDFQQK